MGHNAALVQSATLSLINMNKHGRRVSPGSRNMPPRWALALLSIVLLALTVPSAACDNDADCGVAGTCIKREKGARGVCYGGAPRGAASDEPAPAQPPVDTPSKAVTGERRERAKQWLGDPQQMIKDNLPGKEVGSVCMVTQDCPAGFDCVIAGFEGHCVKL